ncbi:hypothetical protein AVEN_243378-1 [Araneus ventricosus]|uniref:RNase H type-1 domain-containing protein n=1 Tax=Araneus ventricosus TaxID=182803 RepID=A0A4Y2V205_ARAVE|nr:hypothetical protein AVEN_243378-1 [Araneus ventricosus]
MRWLTAHVGHLFNECADQLAKEAITKCDPFNVEIRSFHWGLRKEFDSHTKTPQKTLYGRSSISRKSRIYHQEVKNLPPGSPELTTRKSRTYHQEVQNLPPGSSELTSRKSRIYHQEVHNLPPGSQEFTTRKSKTYHHATAAY